MIGLADVQMEIDNYYMVLKTISSLPQCDKFFDCPKFQKRPLDFKLFKDSVKFQRFVILKPDDNQLKNLAKLFYELMDAVFRKLDSELTKTNFAYSFKSDVFNFIPYKGINYWVGKIYSPRYGVPFIYNVSETGDGIKIYIECTIAIENIKE